MALTGTTLHDRILFVYIIRYVADFGFVFNGSILLGMSGDIHLLPHAFMAQTGTALHDRILVLSRTHYVADYWDAV